MATPDERSLEALLESFETLLDEEQRHLQDTNVAAMETVHRRKENTLAAIKAVLCRFGITRGQRVEDVLAGCGLAVREKYRCIKRRLQENLLTAESHRDRLKEQLHHIDHEPAAMRSYGDPDSYGEPLSVDFSY